ncbi:MAG: 30S ribosomal protein S2, partial [Candidatus Micrarchaeota archaeon]
MGFLVPQEKYLSAGAHIGTRMKHGSMREFIYKSREDGLNVLDLKKLDEHMRMAAALMAKYAPEKVFLVGNKDNARKPIEKAGELAGFKKITGRFTPGRFTNPSRDDFCEPNIVFVIDPGVDKQAVREANHINVPIIALCDTNNSTRYIDVVIPTNNKGRKAIAFMLWLLTREVLRERGLIARDEDYAVQPEDFEA